jgi:PKHD-type hydroxylase
MVGFYIRDGFLSPAECAAARQLFPPPKIGEIAGSGFVPGTRRSRTAFLPSDTPEQRDLSVKLRDAILRANAAGQFLFNICALEPPQLAEYTQGDEYIWHLDLGSQRLRRKLSASVQLSDSTDYDGGDLEFWNTETAPRTQGTLIVFPSYLLHRVTPVTRGTRLSLVAWAIGEEPFR